MSDVLSPYDVNILVRYGVSPVGKWNVYSYRTVQELVFFLFFFCLNQERGLRKVIYILIKQWDKSSDPLLVVARECISILNIKILKNRIPPPRNTNARKKPLLYPSIQDPLIKYIKYIIIGSGMKTMQKSMPLTQIKKIKNLKEYSQNNYSMKLKFWRISLFSRELSLIKTTFSKL